MDDFSPILDLADLAARLAQAEARAAILEHERDMAWRQVGRLRTACRAALSDMEARVYRRATKAFLKMVLE